MTVKKILELAANKEALNLLHEIAEIQEGHFYWNYWEKKAAKAEMTRLAKKIIECLKE